MATSPPAASPGQRDRLDSLGLVKTTSGRSNSLAPNNDWAFRDRGLPPEKEPTKERVSSRDQSTVGTPVSGISEDEDYALEDATPNVYQTYAGRRRAKVPDKEDDLNVVPSGQLPPHQPNGTSSGRRPSRWEQFKAATHGVGVTKVGETTKLRHVMLHWEKEEAQGSEEVLLNARVPQAKVKSQIASQNYVSWQHSQLESLTLKKLEDLVIEAKSQGVQESEIGLTRRLLKRLRLESERPFVGGKFLTPMALRYDSLDSSKYSADKCCIFLAFPYFEIRKEQTKQITVKHDQEHRMRSLLQSVYRLNNTVERDKTQSIRMLSSKKLTSCIKAEGGDLSDISRKGKEELIYVPQLWALVIGLDRLITLGSIGDTSLQGRNFRVREEGETVKKKRCSLVRIRFKNQRRVEDLTYPIQQCASWFGLANKQQQIRAILTKQRENSDPRKYKLEINGVVINASNWISVQRSTQNEVLDLWMETPKQRGPKVSVESPKPPEKQPGDDQHKGTEIAQAGSSNIAIKQGGDQDQQEDEATAGTSDPPIDSFEKLEKAPTISPFLQWRVVDESGHEDLCPLAERVDRFLSLIYRNLPVAVGSRTEGFASANKATKSTITPLAAVKPKPSIGGKTFHDVKHELVQITAHKPKEAADIALDVHELLALILDSFLPPEFQPSSDPIRLFWGAIFEVVSRASQSYLTDLCQKVSVIYAWVVRIHLGVYYTRLEPAPDGREVEHHDISESAILLSSIVDAFGAVFSLLVEAVGDVMCDAKQVQCGKKVSKSFNEAQSLLETARDELIVEASGVAAGEHIGPVVTPEAILIMQMERLVCGVYKNGNVDIISILEQCLESLALKVRYRYSRRLLQMINAFEEEVAAVHDVLLQQKRVLGQYRGYLKPASFDTPSTARKMRFDFEQKGIESILVTLREQLKNCAELQERAKVLAVQNVQLVETMQDDNGRAIFIFTFITILFLPLSFVAGFFGMNLQGINGTTYRASLFWKIAIPFTGGIMLLCIAIIIWGERFWFGMASMPRALAKTYRKRSSL
ncbi:MAG: hypothetical protein Q9195_000510 [Heterodermia aff. obscurata]